MAYREDRRRGSCELVSEDLRAVYLHMLPALGRLGFLYTVLIIVESRRV